MKKAFDFNVSFIRVIRVIKVRCGMAEMGCELLRVVSGEDSEAVTERSVDLL